MGLKRALRYDRRRSRRAFSRTPRGFEAFPSLESASIVGSLSAEPLVGLKLNGALSVDAQAVLSAEPLVGLKHLDHE